jgi:curved DNA-binding protein
MTLAGAVTLRVPPGTQSGQKLRLRGKGMPNPKGASGDLYALISIVVPKEPSGRERELFEELQRVSRFQPRS